jgi:hypothetical protein
MPRWYLGLDLGQAKDFTAISAVERIEHVTVLEPAQTRVFPVRPARTRTDISYHLRHLERPKLGTPYPAIVSRVHEIVSDADLRDCALVVDATGVGAPVVDMLRASGLKPIAIYITGGNAVSRTKEGYHVPKRDLATTLQSLVQTKRLTIAAGLKEGDKFVKELLAFRVKINIATGHDSYEALREGDHDDLVLSVAMVCWYAERGKSSASASAGFFDTSDIGNCGFSATSNDTGRDPDWPQHR